MCDVWWVPRLVRVLASAERFFLTLKQECISLQRFDDRDHAFRVIADWLDRYHTERPRSALGYLTPKEYQTQLAA